MNKQILPTDQIVIGYKVTDANMYCRDYQFTLGEWHTYVGEIAICKSGFHFCEYPSGPWAYYCVEGARVFKVEARGVIKSTGPGAVLKHVAQEIRLVEEIFSTGDRNTGDRNTGDGNTGDGNTGNGNTGNRNTGAWNTSNRNAGDRNTSYGNTGDRNTGYGNTGYGNTGNGNTGERNTGNGNTGERNTGNGNTGDENAGVRNTGNGNIGDGNTGDRNTGDGNVTDRHTGYFCMEEPPLVIFDEPVHSTSVGWRLINELAKKMASDEPIENIEEYLDIPNATVKKIQAVHQAHIDRRKKAGGAI